MSVCSEENQIYIKVEQTEESKTFPSVKSENRFFSEEEISNRDDGSEENHIYIKVEPDQETDVLPSVKTEVSITKNSESDPWHGHSEENKVQVKLDDQSSENGEVKFSISEDDYGRSTETDPLQLEKQGSEVEKDSVIFSSEEGEMNNLVAIVEVKSMEDGGIEKESSNTARISHIRTFKSYAGHHECPICNKTFAYAKSLSAHNRIHTGERRYSCTYCEKHFVHQTSLRRHERIHTDERPFLCDICKSSFREKYSLVNHITCNHNSWPYSCDVCGTSAADLILLKIHKRIHSGE